MKSNITGVIDALSPAAVGSFNTLEPEMAQRAGADLPRNRCGSTLCAENNEEQAC